MSENYYYKIAENKYLEILDDYDATCKYGTEGVRALKTIREDGIIEFEILTPCLVDEEIFEPKKRLWDKADRDAFVKLLNDIRDSLKDFLNTLSEDGAQ